MEHIYKTVLKTKKGEMNKRMETQQMLSKFQPKD